MSSMTVNDTLNEVEHTPKDPPHKRVLELLPGISGGVARVMIGQPFDTIKTRLQVLGAGTALAAKLPPSEVYKDSMDCVRKMVRSEGPLSFYKGTVAPLFGNMILLGIHFPVFSHVRKQLEGDDHYSNFSYTNALISGAAAGAAGSLVSTPVELVRTKMQMQRRAALAGSAGSAAASSGAEVFYKGSVDCFKQVLSKHGVKGLYRGVTSTVLRDMQGYAWFFLGYEATVNYFLQNAGPGVHSKADLNYLQVMAAGVVAGFGLWGSMFPIDTIKSKMQADSLVKPQYSTTYDCVRKVLKTEGNNGLWRGFSAAMYRAIPVNAGIFLAVEATRQGIKLYEENVEHIYGGVVGTTTAA
ncbi:hypothetical protein GPECTOR_16g661 [Gonium pectorale]|uniref:Uncharacterized protein n=1 Tax=Gonium pectorale TaxID=33097 RepID=A0A150GKV6_GONPE|nr:hypothetical protein GPECTOR_16g661 [Gonium pectorale]|eukprot:KXZ50486.1 hypothetical protein GPECTOR_16g661 [Gonium pectorale]